MIGAAYRARKPVNTEGAVNKHGEPFVNHFCLGSSLGRERTRARGIADGMVVSHFLKWIHTARVSGRAAAASAL
ncbi:MAG: hypothetical protein E5X56_31495, partial [Mesorhizobium sp.]